MASTNKTTNYELSQFEGTDKPSWEADYNADMLTIDTNLKAVSNVANAASGDITTLEGRMTTAEGNITTNANDIDALETRCDNLEAGQTSDDGRLDAIEAEQIVQNTAIESNTRLGYNLARPYDSASTYAVGDYVLFQDTLYKCTTAIATGEAFDPNKWLAIKATDEIAAGGYTLPTASASTLGGVKVGNGLNIDPVTGVLSSSGGVTISNNKTYHLITATGARQARGSGDNLIEYPSNKIFVNMNSYTVIGNLRILSVELSLSNTVELPAIIPMQFVFDYTSNIDTPSSTIKADVFSAFMQGENQNNAQPLGIGNAPSMSGTQFIFEVTKPTTALTSTPGIAFFATFVYTV